VTTPLTKKHYTAALELTPKHLGALEYQGELFIALGDLESAAQNLEKNKVDMLGLLQREKNANKRTEKS